MKYRPLIRYYGGKSRISGWVLSHFPKHRVYTEAYGGAASCLLRKERSYAEIYNDLNGELVNLFRVVRDNGPELLRRIQLTPFSRQEMLGAYDHSLEPVEQARRTIVKANMGHGSDSLYRQNRRKLQEKGNCFKQIKTNREKETKMDNGNAGQETELARVFNTLVKAVEQGKEIKNRLTKKTSHFFGAKPEPCNKVPGGLIRGCEPGEIGELKEKANTLLVILEDISEEVAHIETL